MTGTAEDSADVASVTKSVVGTLVGIALSDGTLRGLDTTLAGLLPDYASQMSAQVAAITLEQLLTMTSGLPEDPPQACGTRWKALRTGSPPSSPTESQAAQAPSPTPAAGPTFLAAILVQATQMPLLDYARLKLFGPLGIDTDPAAQPTVADDPAAERAYQQAGFAWPVDPQGINVGYGTLKLTARDMLTIGQVYLDGGRWQERQVVPERCARQATVQHVPVTASQAAAADGWGGQLIEVVPDLRLVVAASTVGDPQYPLDTSYLSDLVADQIIPRLA